MNTKTSTKKEGLNDLSQNYLNGIALTDTLTELFKVQMKRIISAHHQDKIDAENLVRKLIDENQIKLENLEEKFYYGNSLTEDRFNVLKRNLDKEFYELNEMLPTDKDELSNSENLANQCSQIVQNIGKYWGYGNISYKTKLLKVLFLDGLVLNP